jgi:hypothetical protein
MSIKSVKQSYAGQANEWERLLRSLIANLAQLPQLEGARTKLEGLLGSFRELATQQAVHQATKQEMSRQIQAVLRDGRKTAAMIRAVLKEHYGNESEKLVEFGVQPFRARVRKPTVEPPTEPAPVSVPDSQPVK